MNLTEGTYVFTCIHVYTWASQVAQYYRIDLPLQETQEMGGQSLCQEDTLEEEMASQSSILVWRISWIRVRDDCTLMHDIYTYMCVYICI